MSGQQESGELGQLEIVYWMRRAATGSKLTCTELTWPLLFPDSKREREDAVLDIVDRHYPGWVLQGWCVRLFVPEVDEE